MLRGAAAAVVKNMNASLDVPTATSVRAIPAKLMIDNRIVINNHLQAHPRRQGLVHPPAGLRDRAGASRAFPNMNRHFAEIDGKPQRRHPAHTNLGLAIDLQGKNGQRSLVVAAIKRCETMRFAQFIAAYEDIVRARPRRQADRRGLRRGDDLADQPRHASAPCTRCRG